MIKCNAKIAILLATYNGEKYISEQIESLLNQSFKDFNIFIHDDGSSDKTIEIIESFIKENPTKIFWVHGKPTGGPKQNFFYLLSNVEAEYYMFCDQDDYWKKDKIQITLDFMKNTQLKEKKLPILVFSDLEVVDSSLNIKMGSMNKIQKLNPDKVLVKDLLCQNNITGCTIMINFDLRQLSLKVKDYSKIIMHDWWIALVASRYGKIVYCNQKLILYRQHPNNNIGAKKIFSISYIINKLLNISKVRESIIKTRIQAEEFCDCYGVEQNKLIYQYAGLNKENKIERLIFYICNKVWKNGLIRNIGFILWG